MYQPTRRHIPTVCILPTHDKNPSMTVNSPGGAGLTNDRVRAVCTNSCPSWRISATRPQASQNGPYGTEYRSVSDW